MKSSISKKRKNRNFQFFSQHLIDKISENLEHKKQTIILHNRRGYANVECESCGHVTYCSNCDVVMTYHKSTNELKCHYCGHKAKNLKSVRNVKVQTLILVGIGIEQIEEETQKFLRSTSRRMDETVCGKKFAYEKLYEKNRIWRSRNCGRNANDFLKVWILII